MIVHVRVLAVPAPGSAIVAIEAVPGVAGAQTRRVSIVGAPVAVGQDIDGTLDVHATTLTEMPGARNTEGVSQQSIILDAIVFVLGIAILGGLLVWITKRIIIDEKY